MSDGRYNWLELHLGSCPIIMMMLFEHLKLSYKFCFLGTLQFFSLTHFSPVFRFIQKSIKRFALQKKWLVPIWNATMGRNGLKRLSKICQRILRAHAHCVILLFYPKINPKEWMCCCKNISLKSFVFWHLSFFTWEFCRFFLFLFW